MKRFTVTALVFSIAVMLTACGGDGGGSAALTNNDTGGTTTPAPGTLDESFGNGGIVVTDFDGDNDEAKAIAIQSDGKILVAGVAKITNNNNDFALVRYNQDGSLDTSFGISGKVTTNFGNLRIDVACAIALQSDGKIILAGYTNEGDSAFNFAIARYTSNGTLDDSFDSDGKLYTNITSNQNDIAYSVAIQPDGKIVVVGYTGTNADIAIVRYNENGTLDTGFDSDGIVTTDIDSANNYGRAVVIDSNNNILVGGDFGNNTNLFVLRYSSNGTLDTSFNSSGYVTTSIGSGYTYGNSLFLDLNGKILLAGVADITPSKDFAIVRYMTSGTLDTTFDTDGVVTTNFDGTNRNDYAYAVKVDSSGRIIVSGHTLLSGDYDFAVVRYDSNGNLDPSFGKRIYDLGSNDDRVTCMAIQADGKIIIAGRTKNTGTNETNFALIRLLP